MAIKNIAQQITLTDGTQITLEKGKIAPQANAAVKLTTGNLVLLATVVTKNEKAQSFLPLTVDYKEHFASVGTIPGNYHRREGRANEDEIITARLIDRAIRPLFPDKYTDTIMVNVDILSANEEDAPDTYALLAASAALTLSSAPFEGPIAAVRIAEKDGNYLLNPNRPQQEASPFNIVVAGTANHVLMLEGAAEEIAPEKLVDIIKYAQEHIREQSQGQKAFAAQCPITKVTLEDDSDLEKLQQKLQKPLEKAFTQVAAQHLKHKQDRSQAFEQAQQTTLTQNLTEEEQQEYTLQIEKIAKAAKRAAIREQTLQTGKRLDGRAPNQIRPITIEADPLPAPHGSAFFQRGDTQVIGTITLGGPADVKSIDTPTNKRQAQFIAQYEFPGYATGEAKPKRGPARRELGHSELIRKSLYSTLPQDTPYTIRLHCTTLSSDGSSSMASIVAGTVALMDAGINIKRPVAGVTVGSIQTEGNILNIIDITSEEDSIGDADLKIAATKQGITAIQMDIKTKGIKHEQLKEMFTQAITGIKHILGKIHQVQPHHREQPKPQTPAIETVKIDPDKIGKFIGPGGKNIRQLQAQTNTEITIDDSGTVRIFASNQQSANRAREAIEKNIPKLNKVYQGTIESIKPYGAFIKFLPDIRGLLRISEIHHEEEKQSTDTLREGDTIQVKLIKITNRDGKEQYTLSIKAIEKGK